MWTELRIKSPASQDQGAPHHPFARLEYVGELLDESRLALLLGVKVFSRPAEEVVNLLSEHAALDLNNLDLGCSFIFPSLELALWRPFMPESDDDEGHSFSTIGIGEVGYYSSAR